MPKRFRVTPGRLRSVALAALTLLASTEASAQAMGEWGSGERVYRGICRYCHDTGVGPVIKGRGLDPAYVAARVAYAQVQENMGEYADALATLQPIESMASSYDVDFHLTRGRSLEALGREKDAGKAFLEAGRSSSTAFTDQGPAVAPAAADHLADLGVSSD